MSGDGARGRRRRPAPGDVTILLPVFTRVASLRAGAARGRLAVPRRGRPHLLRAARGARHAGRAACASTRPPTRWRSTPPCTPSPSASPTTTSTTSTHAGGAFDYLALRLCPTAFRRDRRGPRPPARAARAAQPAAAVRHARRPAAPHALPREPRAVGRRSRPGRSATSPKPGRRWPTSSAHSAEATFHAFVVRMLHDAVGRRHGRVRRSARPATSCDS